VRFRFADGQVWERVVPSGFTPTLGALDLHLIAEGNHERLWDALGARPLVHEGVEGTAFAVWAPNATRVSVVGDFCRWDGRLCPMRSLGASGVWELFVPGLSVGSLYKFELRTKKGELRPKAGSIEGEDDALVPRSLGIPIIAPTPIEMRMVERVAAQ
jgi:1,4-alpha-glucan branching enzyme